MDHGIGIEVGVSRVVFQAEGGNHITPPQISINITLPNTRQSGCAAADTVIAKKQFFKGNSGVVTTK